MEEILVYLKTSVDETATIEVWDAKAYLNLQMAGLYDYYLVTVLQEKFLLIKPQEEVTIPKSRIHMARIREKTGFEVSLLLEGPTAYKVKKMLQERMAFITSDKQMYLPFMALHIKENRNNLESGTVREAFTAATQLIFLYLLYEEKEEFGVEEIAGELELSAMTVLRGMTELQKLGIVNLEIAGQTGRKKLYRVIDKRKYFRIGKEFLIDPVRRTIFVRCIPKNVKVYKGGLTALSEQTMLGEPANDIYATGEKQNVFSEYRISREEALTEGYPEIQIMKYDVEKIANEQYVDPVTLIMSLKNKDDRTEIAIDELMEDTPWYVG